MKISVSNIAWDKENDGLMYAFLAENGIQGLEIAPTRLFENPYDNLETAHIYAAMLKNRYGLEVSSMQSIWYGIDKNIFTGREERRFLTEYTKKAILFAESMGIKNIVFGCPKNRNMPRQTQENYQIALEFFRRLGDFARRHNTVLAMEANPVIYNTNFLNFTKDACEFVKQADSPGLGVNADMGTVIYNKENPHVVKTYKNIINHIHISAPSLAPVYPCRELETLKKALGKTDWDKYLSLEMKNPGDIEKVKETILFVKRFFDGI